MTNAAAGAVVVRAQLGSLLWFRMHSAVRTTIVISVLISIIIVSIIISGVVAIVIVLRGPILGGNARHKRG